jgi:putative N6-adenine-specific DNA methylase
VASLGVDSGELAFFATAAKGTEPALRDELRELRFRGVRADRGGVHFRGALAEGFRACLELRCAVRVLVELGRFLAPSGDALYEGVRAIDWSAYLSPRHTLAVRAACRSSALTHTQFIAQRTKDGIVDPLRERFGARPSVSLDDPDVVVFVHLVKDEATVYLDLGGASLHRRGYRATALDAPLKETLAAAILRLSGWDRESPLADPMCGSGTLAIEGFLWSRRVAPGLDVDGFGFQRWALYDEGLARRWSELCEAAAARVVAVGPPIFARDVDERAIAVTRDNARQAGARLALACRSVAELGPLAPPGYVVTNPPYGERLDHAPDLYEAMGRSFRRLDGHVISVLAGGPAMARAIGLRPDRAHTLFNGDLECRLLTYDLRGQGAR